MSGGGGGGGGGLGGGFSPAERTPCAELEFRTSIASPQPAAEALTVGDVLQIGLSSGAPIVIQLIDRNGELVGSVISRISDLLPCLQDGFRYEAEVVSVDGGTIQIEVRPA